MLSAGGAEKRKHYEIHQSTLFLRRSVFKEKQFNQSMGFIIGISFPQGQLG